MSVRTSLPGPRSRLNRRGPGVVAAASLSALLALLFGFGGCGLPTSGTASTGDQRSCTSAAHCDDKNPCTVDTCGEDNLCSADLVPDGPQAQQLTGDCRVLMCVGGQPSEQPTDSDVLDDRNDCTFDTCVEGEPRNTPKPDGDACAVGTVQGACRAGQCVVPCGPDQPSCDDGNPCTDDACDAVTSQCVNTPRHGEPPIGHVEEQGDCGVTVCSSGQVQRIVDETETPAPANDCMQGLCNGGTPTQVPLPAQTSCGSSGDVCDGAGTCGQCNSASDCVNLPDDGACATRTCVNHVCGQVFTGAGTLVPNQTVGDCQVRVCDGAGAEVSMPDDTDFVDDGNECTIQDCNNGQPRSVDASLNTPCGGGNQLYCNGAGACVGCTANDQCGQGTFCGERVCNPSQQCVWAYTAAGTPLPDDDQEPGDCKQVQCSGTSETPVTVTLGTDTPQDDGNQCTLQICNGDMPDTVYVPLNSVCNQNGGRFCSGMGACVDCTMASQCQPGSNVCILAACNAGACGFTNVPAGTPQEDTTLGDCRRPVCTGNGGIQLDPFDLDLPNDGHTCTQDLCTNGTPSHPPVPDGTACSENGGQVCMAGVCKRSPGQTCSANVDCASGFCVDDRCCSTACYGDCVSCGNPQGQCTPLPLGTTDTCTGGAQCNGMGECRLPTGLLCMNGAQCLSGYCTDGVCCNEVCGDACESCAVPGLVGTCSPTAEGQQDDCNPGEVCHNGSCSGEGGSQCNSPSDCASGFCIDGVCCATACNEPCHACDVTGSVGTCAPDPLENGQQDTCSNVEVCDDGACKRVDGQTCNAAAQCASDVCIDGVCCATACNEACHACDVPGSVGTCSPDPSLDDQQDTCNPNELCSNGTCTADVGVACSVNSDCASGFCVDEVCCATACNEACRACDVPGSEGTCSPDVSLNGQQETCDPGEQCSNGTCTAALGAICSANGDCASGHCVDGVCCATACDDACWACDVPGSEGTCSPDGALDGQQDECGDDEACDDAGACTALVITCSEDDDCASGFCADGVCCGTACDEACHTCDLPGAEGTCLPDASLDGQPDTCDDPEVCDDSGACVTP
ncbi:hypothetical protein [Chondromyces crocatus]|uniref:Disintegrin domain-containing protein n=1 Tax=Chondromyces crocatus TaxID=52 RepID=A0A0K1EJA8_CHOCO|nr:hypothetical protein [Chondromyces crocatus]AKT40663.1 uncharacterized protein CMC5_048190 [Chondromyces crocatus]